MRLIPHLTEYRNKKHQASAVKQLKWSDTETGLFISLILAMESHSDELNDLSAYIMTALKKYLLEYPSAPTLEENFEEALKDINHQLKAIQKELNLKRRLPLQAIITIIDGSEMCLTQTGEAEIYLVRKGKFTVIGESSKSEEEDYFVNIASGELSAQDVLLFVSSRLLRFLTPAQLTTLFKDDRHDPLTVFEDAAYTDSDFPAAISILKLNAHQNTGDTTNNKWLPSASFFNNVWQKGLKQFEGNKSLTFSGIIIVTIILVLSISILNSEQISTQQSNEMQNSLTHIGEELKRAENLNVQGNKTEASNILDKVSGDIKDILNSGEYRKEAIALSAQIDEQKALIQNIEYLKTPQILTDVSEINAIGLIANGSTLYALRTNALYEIILNVVEKQPINISEDAAMIMGVAMPDKSMYFYGSDGRVREVDLNNWQVTLPDTEDTTWKVGTGIDIYGTRNLYIFSPSENQIWKYPKKRFGFGKATPYLLEKVDLSRATDFSVSDDGYIFVTTVTPPDPQNESKVNILAFYAGKTAEFNVDGLPAHLMTQADKIVAGTQYIYIADYSKNTITVIRRQTDLHPPTYIRQFVIPDNGQIKDFTVDKNDQQLHVLTDSSILKINL